MLRLRSVMDWIFLVNASSFEMMFWSNSNFSVRVISWVEILPMMLHAQLTAARSLLDWCLTSKWPKTCTHTPVTLTGGWAGWKMMKRHLILGVELSEWTVTWGGTPFQNVCVWTLSASSERLLAWELEVGEGGEGEEVLTVVAVKPADGSLPHNPPPRVITAD